MTSKTKNKKRVDFSVRPRPAREALPADADQWVREGGRRKTRRNSTSR